MEKSERAIQSAERAIQADDMDTACNRIYYALFYAVMALGYFHHFATSKHTQLMGWFNKKFIHEEHIFPPEMYQIYKVAYDQRQESDYNIAALDNVRKEDIILSLEQVKQFVNQTRTYLNVR
jgi:uncharacterized protein (UPF0332 family)